MASSIRKQIIENIISRFQTLLTSNGYLTDAGKNVFRARPVIDPDDLPAVNVFAFSETNEAGAGQSYGYLTNTMKVQIEALKLLVLDHLTEAENLLADLLECALSIEWTLSFESGGIYWVSVGDTVEGETSGATGYVAAVQISAGTWPGGDAEGTLVVRRVTGEFQQETLKVGSETNVCEVNANPIGQGPIDLLTGGLAASIEYTEGGIDEFPGVKEKTIGNNIQLNVKYNVLAGDPYHQ